MENIMIVTRKSVLTGKTRSRDIPVRAKDLELYNLGVGSASDILHYLSNEDREFVMCGITDYEFKNAFSKELQAIVNDKINA
jgi:hypothetical protein